MVGITLSPEQIRAAPPEVRQWLEHEIAASLGLRAREPEAAEAGAPRLVACGVDDAAAVLGQIQDMLPVVNVFFELGREGASAGGEGIEAFRLVDILRHTRLQSVEQIITCLRIINDAACRVLQDAEASLCVVERRGYCLVAAPTRQSIHALWQQFVGEHDLHDPLPGQAPDAPAEARPRFAAMAGKVSPAAVHLGDYVPPGPKAQGRPGAPGEEPAGRAVDSSCGF